jgi:hypothetical protein
MKVLKALAILAAAGAALVHAQSVSLDGKAVSIKPATAVAGTAATLSLHTDADIVFKGATVTKGDYSLFVVGSGGSYQLVVNKGAAGKARDPKLDVGKVAMVVTKPPAPVGAGHANLVKVAAFAAKVEVGVEGSLATAQFKLDRVSANSEW